MKDTLGKIGAVFLYGFYALLRSSCRIRVVGRGPCEELGQAGKAFIYAGWHSNVFFGPALGPFDQRTRALVSPRGAGRLYHPLLRMLGYGSIAGSSSRDGFKALMAIVRCLRGGGVVAVSPDGPWGPAQRVKEGLVTATCRSRAPVIPIHFECSTGWVRKNSWDRTRIPKPFSTVILRYGPPVYVGEEQEREEIRVMLEKALGENQKRCRELLLRYNQKL